MALLPFYWGFDLGLDVPDDDMVKMLTVIEQHADELAAADPSFKQIGHGRLAAFQKQALRIDVEPRADSPGAREIPQVERHVGQQVGRQHREGNVTGQ